MQNAAWGLVTLAAIPTVMIALWADYFGRHLDESEAAEPEFERDLEYQTIRLAGLLGIFLQVLLYVCAGELREAAPLPLHYLPLVGISLQAWIQARLERKLRLKTGVVDAAKPSPLGAAAPGSLSRSDSTAGTPYAHAAEVWRAFIWSVAAGGLYAVIMIGSLVLATLAVHWGKFGPVAATGTLFLATVAGVLAGLGVNFALSPFFMRKMLDARAATAEADVARQARVSSVFEASGFTAPALYVVESGRPVAGAVLSGLGGGRGIFAPVLFVTRPLADSLTDGQFQAVVAHELSHLSLNHLRKRLLYAAVLVIAVAGAASLLVLLSQWVLPSGANLPIGLLTGAGAFFIAFHSLRAQSRRHEIEADAFCVSRAGIAPADLVTALRKLHGLNDPLGGSPSQAERLLASLGHPELAERIRLIEALRPESATGDLAAATDSQDVAA